MDNPNDYLNMEITVDSSVREDESLYNALINKVKELGNGYDLQVSVVQGNVNNANLCEISVDDLIYELPQGDQDIFFAFVDDAENACGEILTNQRLKKENNMNAELDVTGKMSEVIKEGMSGVSMAKQIIEPILSPILVRLKSYTPAIRLYQDKIQELILAYAQKYPDEAIDMIYTRIKQNWASVISNIKSFAPDQYDIIGKILLMFFNKSHLAAAKTFQERLSEIIMASSNVDKMPFNFTFDIANFQDYTDDELSEWADHLNTEGTVLTSGYEYDLNAEYNYDGTVGGKIFVEYNVEIHDNQKIHDDAYEAIMKSIHRSKSGRSVDAVTGVGLEIENIEITSEQQ